MEPAQEFNLTISPFAYVLFFITAAISSFWNFKMRQFIETLRKEEHSVWLDLGSPVASAYFNPLARNKLERFISNKGYKRVKNDSLRKQAKFLLLIHKAYISSAVFTCLAFLGPIMLDVLERTVM